MNVGTTTGRGRELADLMERRKVGVLCVQETRWKGDKANELGGGCKLPRSGANKQGRNGVGIVISKDLKEDLISVSKRSDRVMRIKLGVEETVVNIICAYAPQVGCTEEEKETFWEQMDQELSATLDDERVIVGGDLNGHIGRSRDGIERIHGGWGMRDRNDEGENIVDTAMAFDLAIVNTFFEKKVNQFVTYNSGGRESQIDFLMYRRCHLNDVINGKVINGEAVAAQHRVVVMDWEIQRGKKRKPEQATPRIKWWRLREDNLKVQFREKVLDKVRPVESVQEWWEETSTRILRVGQEVLGLTTGRRPPGDKETWWWNGKVQEVIKAKKVAKKIWETSRRQEDKDIYRQANKATNKALAMNELYEELATPEGETKIFRLAKARDKASKDFPHMKQTKNEHGVILRDLDMIIGRWKGYFDKLLNEENPRSIFDDGVPNNGLKQGISRNEVKVVISRMKNGKAT